MVKLHDCVHHGSGGVHPNMFILLYCPRTYYYVTMLIISMGLLFIYYGYFLGATESIGKHMLEACNNNLEMAVTMFLDGGGIAEEPSTSSGSAAASSSRAPPEE